MAIAQNQRSDTWVVRTIDERERVVVVVVVVVVVQMPGYQLASCHSVVHCLLFAYLSRPVLHHICTLPCPSVRMRLYRFVAISGRLNLGRI